MRDEIKYPFSNFKGATVEVWEWKNNFISNFTGNAITYPYCVGWNWLSILKHQGYNRWRLRMDEQFHPTIYRACDCLFILGLKLFYVIKMAPGESIVFSLCISVLAWFKQESSIFQHSQLGNEYIFHNLHKYIGNILPYNAIVDKKDWTS